MSFETEIAAARGRMAAGELDAAMLHLERAHVIGQLLVWPHVLSHWLMLQVELRRGRPLAAFGQLVRIVLGALGSAVGVVPTGNTGGSDISMFQRLPVPNELQDAIDTQPRNMFAHSSLLAWLITVLLAITVAWPGTSKEFAPAVGWGLLLAVLALAVLLSAPSLWPRHRATACKVLSIAVTLVCFLFVAPSVGFGLGLMVGFIFREAGAR